ncbi:hypothetical protein TIFTF001_030799 [Ficus carica]|uniref:Uncharacterized protein n=1 Tax=Ficus carica TaxID=3494 RepID=A0AA88DYV2_FICCA|nr:hypothetical protein TIFTF001_030799 [Ficus carica]
MCSSGHDWRVKNDAIQVAWGVESGSDWEWDPETQKLVRGMKEMRLRKSVRSSADRHVSDTAINGIFRAGGPFPVKRRH